MIPLAKLWTRIGSYFLPLAIAWAVYIRNGLDKAPPEGVSISRAYWGLLATLVAGSMLAVTLALYVRAAKRKPEQSLLPPNTSFEEMDDRSPVISRATVAVFALTIVFALLMFGARYADSKIYCWDSTTPLADSLFDSRLAAYSGKTCEGTPRFAIARRMQGSTPIDGVNEYVLYLTDGALLALTLIFSGCLLFLAVTWCL